MILTTFLIYLLSFQNNYKCGEQIENKIEITIIHYPIEDVFEYTFFEELLYVSKLTDSSKTLIYKIKLDSMDVKQINQKVKKLLNMSNEFIMPVIDGFRYEVKIFKDEKCIKFIVIENVILEEIDFLIEFTNKKK
jgi:hypothetical protein